MISTMLATAVISAAMGAVSAPSSARAIVVPESAVIEVANRKGSKRVGGTNSKGKGSKYVGGKKK